MCWLTLSSSAKDDIDPTKDEIKLCPRQPSGVLGENISIYGHDLRDIRYGILRKACSPPLQEHIAGSRGPSQIAR
jgi:hypothetical protein